jgi:hypothetical protein
MAFNGRVTGISGIMNGALSFARSEMWRWFFLGGLLGGSVLYEYVLAPQPTPVYGFAPLTMIVAGFLVVGYGTRMGNGCTSGHGVCGLGPILNPFSGSGGDIYGYGLCHGFCDPPFVGVLGAVIPFAENFPKVNPA